MILTMSDAAIQYFQGFLDCFTVQIAVRNDVNRGYRCFYAVWRVPARVFFFWREQAPALLYKTCVVFNNKAICAKEPGILIQR